jgi:hypothetical protein
MRNSHKHWYVQHTFLGTYYLRCPYDLTSGFHEGISALHEQTVNQWREFVVTAVLADYQKTSRLAHSHSDCEKPPSWLFYSSIDPCAVPSQPSWSLMQALLSLTSYLHSVDTPSNPSRFKSPNNIALTTLRRFTASLIEVLATSHHASGGQRDSQANWDLRFLRRLLTLWTTNWHGLSELDQLIEKLQVM